MASVNSLSMSAMYSGLAAAAYSSLISVSAPYVSIEDRDDGLRVGAVVVDAAEQAGEVTHDQVAVLVDPCLRREQDVAVGRQPEVGVWRGLGLVAGERSWIGWFVT